MCLCRQFDAGLSVILLGFPSLPFDFCLLGKGHLKLKAFLDYLPPGWACKGYKFSCLSWCPSPFGLFYRHFCSIVAVCLWPALYTGGIWSLVIHMMCLCFNRVMCTQTLSRKILGTSTWQEMFKIHQRQHGWKVLNFNFCPVCYV